MKFMKRSLILSCAGALLVFSDYASANTFYYTCNISPSGTCCDPTVTSCASGSIPYATGSNSGKLVLTQGKSITMQISCTNGYVTSWKTGTSSSNVTCTASGNTVNTNKVTINCTNWAFNNVQLWLNSSSCN